MVIVFYGFSFRCACEALYYGRIPTHVTDTTASLFANLFFFININAEFYISIGLLLSDTLDDFAVFMALGIYQVTCSNCKFCWFVCPGFATLGTSR